MHGRNWQAQLLYLFAAASSAAAFLAPGGCSPSAGEAPPASIGAGSDGFDGERAFAQLESICTLGPRVSGSAAMKQQRILLTEHFRALGGHVRLQDFAAQDPRDGSPLTMTNLIVTWHPEAAERILFCTHLDTRPFPDRDRYRPQGTFVGANGGASGVALLMELGRQMPQLGGRYGVDFVFFDGEEQVYDEKFDPQHLGSRHFARNYVNERPAHRYQCGVLLDMVADRELQLAYDKRSFEQARQPTVAIWETAQRLGVAEFVPRVRHGQSRSQAPLVDIAAIPVCRVSDDDYPLPDTVYPYTRTEADLPVNCSAESLDKVGAVLLEWLKTAE
jgi:hypothetical protein